MYASYVMGRICLVDVTISLVYSIYPLQKTCFSSFFADTHKPVNHGGKISISFFLSQVMSHNLFIIQVLHNYI